MGPVSPGAELLAELRVLRIVVALRLLLGVQVVEVAEELVEAVIGRQVLIPVAQVVLAKLPAGITVRLEQGGERRHLVANAMRRARHADGEQSRAERMLTENERGPPGGATLLGIPVSEQGAFVRYGINTGRLISHHSLVVGVDVPVTDVVAPDDNDVGLIGR
jgi:hypothetical protein